MKCVLVRYTVKPGHAARNEELVRAVYRELDETQPAGLRYATFVLDDGQSFVHLAEIEAEPNPLPEVRAFKAFQTDLGQRCEQPPAATELREIGAFRWAAR